jgi:NAD(P)-dependent dehydrogenase (short-subunit alcohol dehydrogenase family)
VALIQLVIPHMLAAGGGSIVVTGSLASQKVSPGIMTYVASKSALRGVVRSAALELARIGIRVNLLEPGAIDNEMLAAGFRQVAPDSPETIRQGLAAMIPIGRLAANEELAKAALFLASDDSSYCTGSILAVDGGASVT